jgi:hypothetical protein
MSGRRTLIKVLAVVGAAGSIAGVAFAATTSSPAPAPAVPQERSATAISQVDDVQGSTMGILRRTVAKSDEVPAAARDLIAHGSGPALGANPALARLALTTRLGEQLYVVPASGWVCLTSSEASGICSPTDRIAEGSAVGLHGIPSGFRLSGLVPDGVDRVEVRGERETASTATSGNAWQIDVAFEPTSVAWTGPAGEKVARVSVPPAAPQGPAAPASVLDPAPAAG